jgi:hypothetical protein
MCTLQACLIAVDSKMDVRNGLQRVTTKSFWDIRRSLYGVVEMKTLSRRPSSEYMFGDMARGVAPQIFDTMGLANTKLKFL